MSEIIKGRGPYALDVARLIETFPAPTLEEGVVIEHAAFEGTIDCKRGTGRYYGVVNAWIRKMKQAYRIHIVWARTVGVKVLDPAGLAERGETVFRQKCTQTCKAAHIIDDVPRERLDQVGQMRLDHLSRVMRFADTAMIKAKSDLAVELGPIHSLPKPKWIAEGESGT